jgi:hypothetical protein
MMTIDSQYFIEKADQCFRLARSAGAEPVMNSIATELDALANEFLRKAVEIDAERDRLESRGSD